MSNQKNLKKQKKTKQNQKQQTKKNKGYISSEHSSVSVFTYNEAACQSLKGKWTFMHA